MYLSVLVGVIASGVFVSVCEVLCWGDVYETMGDLVHIGQSGLGPPLLQSGPAKGRDQISSPGLPAVVV